MENLLHLRYKPKRTSFKNCKPCPVFEAFDWVIWNPDVRMPLKISLSPPKYVLCLAHRRSLNLLIKFRFYLKNVVLVIAGEDTNYSKVKDLVDKLRRHCKAIYYEALDIEDPYVDTFSMGFISYYLNRTEAGLIEELTKKVDTDECKKEGVLAAWGGIWKSLDNSLVDRQELCKFVEGADWISREDLGPNEYWNRLAQVKFLLAPSGAGIQAPKLAEGWLMNTVPIVTSNPCFRKLKEMGYPLLIVKEWAEVTPQLMATYERDFLGDVNWAKVKYMLTTDYFVKEILGKR